jgi:antitoxin (DNA-binding transcriptional repressor) of toxin-antitoxin stability system
MSYLTVSEARKHFRKIVSSAELAGVVTVLVRHDEAVAAVVPISLIDQSDLGPLKKKPSGTKRPKKTKTKSA